MTRHRLFCLLFALVASGILAGTAYTAQQTLPTIANEAEVDFPNSVTFRLELEPGIVVKDARLTYQLGRQSCFPAGTQVPVETNDSTLEWTWVMSRSGNPPPGASMWWEWHITTSSGEVFLTPRKTVVFSDNRFDWRLVERDPIQLYWYEGDDVGPALLDAAVVGLETIEEDIGIELQGEVQIFIYSDAADMREALLYIEDWAGGVAFSDYNTILIGVPPRLVESWGKDTVRHELAHLVLEQFGQSCLGGSRPTWLEEGLATYAQGEPDEAIMDHIEDGIENDLFMPLRSLNGPFPAEEEDAGRAYSQSYSIVNFLLTQYGKDRLGRLILSLAAANGYDQALEEVYGFNVDGLEAAWRKAIGAPPRDIPPTPTPLSASAIPTAIPLSGASSMPTPDMTTAPSGQVGIEGDEDQGSRTVCGFGLIPVALLAFLFNVRGRYQNFRRQR